VSAARLPARPLAAQSGQAPVPEVVSIDSLTTEARSPGSTAPLTRRQFQIAELISQGLSNEAIAERLVLTPGTVGNHVGHILRRLGATNRTQVAAWVFRTTASGDQGAARV
jgi:DNA-binding NarL/FixJ family response regulator